MKNLNYSWVTKLVVCILAASRYPKVCWIVKSTLNQDTLSSR